LDFDQGKIIPR